MLSIRRMDSSNSQPGPKFWHIPLHLALKFWYLSFNLEIHSSWLIAAFHLIYSVSDLVSLISFLRLRSVQSQLTQATLGGHRQHFTTDAVIDVAIRITFCGRISYILLSFIVEHVHGRQELCSLALYAYVSATQIHGCHPYSPPWLSHEWFYNRRVLRW